MSLEDSNNSECLGDSVRFCLQKAGHFVGSDGDKIGILSFTPFLSDFHNVHA